MFKKFIFDPSSVTTPNNLSDRVIVTCKLHFNQNILKGYCNSTQHKRENKGPKISWRKKLQISDKSNSNPMGSHWKNIQTCDCSVGVCVWCFNVRSFSRHCMQTATIMPLEIHISGSSSEGPDEKQKEHPALLRRGDSWGVPISLPHMVILPSAPIFRVPSTQKYINKLIQPNTKVNTSSAADKKSWWILISLCL